MSNNPWLAGTAASEGYEAAIRVRMGRHAWILDGMVSLVAIYLLGLSAHLRVAVPFSPVPITAQTLVVLLTGALLGRRRGAATLLGYMAVGALGLPFFAGAGLTGPTGGYLLGFVAAAYLTGLLVERGWGRRPGSALLALLAGNLAIYAVGLPWLALFVGPRAVLALGLLPFVVGDLLKVVCAAGVVYARSRR